MNNEMTVAWCIENLSSFSNNASYASLLKKSVLFLTPVPDEITASVEAAGARKITRLPGLGDRPSFNVLCQKLGDLQKKRFDRIFLDMREIDAVDFGSHSSAFFSIFRGMLSPEGAMFCTFEAGHNDRNFDVQNMFVLSHSTWLPGKAYLLDSVLRDWAVRTMKSVGGVTPHTDLLLLRLVPKLPTMLLICGKSMSGKTTLARELTHLNPQMHVSNDFIYTQLVRKLKNDGGDGLHHVLIAHLGNGSGQACGNFNRALESVPGLMDLYLPHLIASIPRSQPIISIDFDLRTDKAISELSGLFKQNGFSVWVVRRQ